jgi:hypothetical protein
VRRFLASLLALALCAFAPSAGADDDEATGTLVVVSNGPGEGTATLPAGLSVWGQPTTTGDSPYVLLGMSARGKQRSFGFVRYPPGTRREWDYREQPPAGRSTVRMIAVGRTTVRIPVRGMRGTRTVRLDRRLREGLVDIRTIPVRDVQVVEDVIPFTLPARSLLAHGVVRHALVSTVANDETCTTIRGDRCGGLSLPPELPWANPGGDEWMVLHGDFWAGPGDAVTRFAQVAAYPEPVTHFLLVLPMP